MLGSTTPRACSAPHCAAVANVCTAPKRLPPHRRWPSQCRCRMPKATPQCWRPTKTSGRVRMHHAAGDPQKTVRDGGKFRQALRNHRHWSHESCRIMPNHAAFRRPDQNLPEFLVLWQGLQRFAGRTSVGVPSALEFLLFLAIAGDIATSSVSCVRTSDRSEGALVGQPAEHHTTLCGPH